MLQIAVQANELFDEKTGIFIPIKAQTLHLEHSLISLSKWESKWHKPFLSKKVEKTNEEVIDYIRCMCMDSNIDPVTFYALSAENYKQIDDYIKDPMTATTFHNLDDNKRNKEIVTSEIIYYWMTELNIPPEYAKWHLNRLLTLIQVASIKKSPPKKMSKNQILARNRKLNEAARAKYHSKG